jgi:hypothetical protein
VGGVSAAVSKTAAAPIERVKLLIQNQVRFISPDFFHIRPLPGYPQLDKLLSVGSAGMHLHL